ncbi:MAG: DUF2924 domain-containing protein [Rhodopila sp.]|nr:DUF2924 domain-containing protein [Rhodopila sp.]
MRKTSTALPAPKFVALSPTQRQVLDQATTRPDLNLLPLPESLQLTGRPRLRVLHALLNRGLAEERPRKDKAGSWRRDKEGKHWALHLSKTGLVMVRPEATSSASRHPTKQDQVLAALAAPGGASLDDLVALTGWLPAPHYPRRPDSSAPARSSHYPHQDRRPQDLPSRSARRASGRSRVTSRQRPEEQGASSPEAPLRFGDGVPRHVPAKTPSGKSRALLELAPRLAGLGAMEREELIAAWRRLFRSGPPERVRRDLLELGIAWKLQERAFGGLKKGVASELRRLAEDLATTGDIRRVQATAPKSGTCLLREWGGVTHEVTVLDDGFIWNGTQWNSLSGIARHITGAHWSGPRFFGLAGRAEKPAPSAEETVDA